MALCRRTFSGCWSVLSLCVGQAGGARELMSQGQPLIRDGSELDGSELKGPVSLPFEWDNSPCSLQPSA